MRFGNVRVEFITYQPSLMLFRSELTASFISAIDFDENEMLVSSAYIVTFVLCNARGKSFLYIKNSSRPRHDPCGMLQYTFAIFDMYSLTLQN